MLFATTRLGSRAGYERAKSNATMPPAAVPRRWTFRKERKSISAWRSSTAITSPLPDCPCPRRSYATTRYPAAEKAGTWWRHIRVEPVPACRRTSAAPAPPVSSNQIFAPPRSACIAWYFAAYEGGVRRQRPRAARRMPPVGRAYADAVVGGHPRAGAEAARSRERRGEAERAAGGDGQFRVSRERRPAHGDEVRDLPDGRILRVG